MKYPAFSVGSSYGGIQIFFFNHPITIQFSMGPLKYTPDVTELVQSMF